MKPLAFPVLIGSLMSATLAGCQPATTPAPATQAEARATSAPPPPAAPETRAATPANATAAAPAATDSCDRTLAFAPGADSIDTSGAVSGYTLCNFRFAAKAGQRVHVDLDGSTYLVALLYAPASADTALAGPEDALAAVLPEDGEYQIRVGQVRAEARRSRAPKTFKLSLRLC